MDITRPDAFVYDVTFDEANIIGIPEGAVATWTYTGSYTDSNVVIGKYYSYAIVPCDAAGNEAVVAYFSVIQATDTTKPTAITNLVATANSGTLTITLVSNNAANIHI